LINCLFHELIPNTCCKSRGVTKAQTFVTPSSINHEA
jgi:hypothetical protein